MKHNFLYVLVPLGSIAGLYLIGFLNHVSGGYFLPQGGTDLLVILLPQLLLGYFNKEIKHVLKIQLVSSLILSIFAGFIMNGVGTGFEESIPSEGYNVGLILSATVFFYIPIFTAGMAAIVVGSIVRYLVMSFKKNKHTKHVTKHRK